MAETIVRQPAATERQKHFSQLPAAELERSTFDMSHAYKTTMDYNRIVPILLQEVLPGDTFKCRSTVFMRLATPIKPIMDNIDGDIHYFFVPNRLVWDNWQAFMGERDEITDNPDDLSVPQVSCDMEGTRVGLSLIDYFALPIQEKDGAPDNRLLVNALPFRGYQLIFNEWYRNQNLQGIVDIYKGDDTVDGSDVFEGVAALRFRHKRADYFTRALPWPQKGDPVFLPLGTTAPVLGIGWGDQVIDTTDRTIYDSEFDARGTVTYFNSKEVGGDNSQVFIQGIDRGDGWQPFIRTNLNKATAATINDIRTAFQVQKMLERDARGGTRYIEIILSHFNVQSPDMRLQRPEFLGSGKGKVIVNPVASTVPDPDTPQGNLAAVGTGVIKGGFNHSFVEHGFLFGLLSCRADLTYQNGVDRMWNRKTRYDYYWPALSHLGEQAILNQEIFWLDTDDADNTVNYATWGYQERYAEYRYQPSRITGLFRSNVTASLDVWHLAQDFDELPPLNPF